jgi:hypothetical protein
MNQVKLSVVIHTEEEFDWSGGFSAKNNQVTHAKELFAMCEDMLAIGCKITLALDYAFVDSEQGQWFIDSMLEKHRTSIEFAAHLHPWVIPPLMGDTEQFIEERDSYPGNLSEALEFQKLSALTHKIEALTEVRPRAYLAGRYGVGPNTYQILERLGYNTDVSITPFTNYEHQQGPDFSNYNNTAIKKGLISCIPHSTGYISYLSSVSDWLNREVNRLPTLNKHILGKILLKLLGVKKVRFSPEGFSAPEMRKLSASLKRIGIDHLIYSFHSSSAMLNGSPYSCNSTVHKTFLKHNLLALQHEKDQSVCFSFLGEQHD